jgi:hypothetical protein
MSIYYWFCHFTYTILSLYYNVLFLINDVFDIYAWQIISFVYTVLQMIKSIINVRVLWGKNIMGVLPPKEVRIWLKGLVISFFEGKYWA